MRRVVQWRGISDNSLTGIAPVEGLTGYEALRGLAGYVLEPPVAFLPQRGVVRGWGCLMVLTGPLGEPDDGGAAPALPRPTGAPSELLRVRLVGRLAPRAAPQSAESSPSDLGATGVSPRLRTLRPVGSGQAYCISSPPGRGLVQHELASALETVFEHFAHQRGFTSAQPLEIHLSRGFKAGSPGHGQGRAADIAAVGGRSLLAWKGAWDQALAAEDLSDPQQRTEAIAVEQKRNLGYGLYKALQAHGGWRVNQQGWRPYRGMMQLFGPWTATEGPWKQMQIENPNAYQQQRIADQNWVFQAHQDHIHVSR